MGGKGRQDGARTWPNVCERMYLHASTLETVIEPATHQLARPPALSRMEMGSPAASSIDFLSHATCAAQLTQSARQAACTVIREPPAAAPSLAVSTSTASASCCSPASARPCPAAARLQDHQPRQRVPPLHAQQSQAAGAGNLPAKNWYTSRFVRVILAQGPC